jgi:cell division septal protein FtsQ
MEDWDYQRSRSNTRDRIAERRRRGNRPADQSAVLPGPRRTLGTWLFTGRIASIPLLFLAAVTLVYVTASPRFRVRDVRVQGTDLLRPEVAVQLSEATGHSIWLVDTDRVVANIRTNAYVEQAGAYLTLPDRLTIVVRERRPEVRWQSGSQLLLVDGEGRVMGPDVSTPLTGTLVIEDRSGQVFEPNDRIDADALVLGRALSLRLPAELGVTPGRIAWSADTGIVTDLGGRTVIFDDPEYADP